MEWGERGNSWVLFYHVHGNPVRNLLLRSQCRKKSFGGGGRWFRFAGQLAGLGCFLYLAELDCLLIEIMRTLIALKQGPKAGLWCSSNVLGCTRTTLIQPTSFCVQKGQLFLEYSLDRRVWGIFWAWVVMGIDACNYSPWTRNVLYPRLIRTQRIRPWFLYTPPVVACDG